MCQLGGVSRCGYYRAWAASAPREADTALRHTIQLLALQHRHYGYRRITALLRRQGEVVNAKRVRRLMREDNLLCVSRRSFVPATTELAPSLGGLSQPGALDGSNSDQSALGGRHHLCPAGRGVRLSGGGAGRVQPQGSGLGLADHLRASLTLEALEMALTRKFPPQTVNVDQQQPPEIVNVVQKLRPRNPPSCTTFPTAAPPCGSAPPVSHA